MILEVYNSVASYFGIKVITRYGFVLVLYLFLDISSFKSEKGHKINVITQCAIK